jgi:hypothetical protein
MPILLQSAGCPPAALVQGTAPRAAPAGAESYLPLGLFAGAVAIALLLHIGEHLSIPFLVGSVAFAFWAMRSRPRLYIAFTFLLYLFTPLIRRMEDFESSYHDPSAILAAPLVVSLLSLLALPALLRQSSGRKLMRLLPFSAALLAVFYGVAIGFFKSEPIELVRPSLEWLAPLAFGAYSFFHAAEHDVIALIERISLLSIISLGIYGVFQFIDPMPWDIFWLQNFNQTHFQPSFGQPERFGIRLFSTLNSPQTFAALLAYAFPVFAMLRSNVLSLMLMPLLLLCLALTQSRSQLFTVAVACVLLLIFARGRALFRLGVLAAMIAATLTLGAVSPDISNKISDRLNSFGNLKYDESAVSRRNGMRLALEMIATEPFGQGIGFPDGEAFEKSDLHNKYGVDTHDLGLVEVGVSFGYLGGLLYAGGFAFALVLIARRFFAGDRGHLGVLVAIFSSLATMATVNLFLGLPGIWLWGAVGCLLGSAGLKRVIQEDPA